MTNNFDIKKYLVQHLLENYLEGELLLENIQKKMDGIKKAFSNTTVNYSHDEHAEHKDNNSIIDYISDKADPTPKKEYTQWLTKQYSGGKFFQHDLTNDDNFIKSTVNNFNTLKNRKLLPEDKRDINKLSYEDMHELVNEFSGAKSNKEKKFEVREEALKGATKLLDENDVKIYKTEAGEEGKAAHKILGAGSTWCTAAENNNMYDAYTKTGKNPAPLYVVIDNRKGKKYNFHFGGEKGEFADENNIHHNIGHFVKEVPEILKIKDEIFTNSKCQNKSLLVPFYNEHEATKKFQDLVDNPNSDTKHYAENTPSVAHLTQLYSKFKDRDYGDSEIVNNVMKNGYTPQHIRDSAFEDPKASNTLKMNIASNSYNPKHAMHFESSTYDYGRVLNSTPSTEVLDIASKKTNLNPEHVEKILQNPKVNNEHRKNIIENFTNPSNEDLYAASTAYDSAVPTNRHHALDDWMLSHHSDDLKGFGILKITNTAKLKKFKSTLSDEGDIQFVQKNIDKLEAQKNKGE